LPSAAESGIEPGIATCDLVREHLFGLVNAPVKMYSAIDEHDLELHLVHEKDGSPIGYRKVCKKEDEEVPADEIVKAYEASDGKLVYLTDADFRAAEEESVPARSRSSTSSRTPRSTRSSFQRTYYLGPAEGAEKVYALSSRRWKLPRLSAGRTLRLPRRQQLGTLRVRDGVITLENMYFADEIRATEDIVPGRRPRVDKKELEMAGTLIERFTSSFDHSKYKDEYQAKLRAVVRRKLKGQEVHAPGGKGARGAVRPARGVAGERRRREAFQELEGRRRAPPRTAARSRRKRSRANRAQALVVDEIGRTDGARRGRRLWRRLSPVAYAAVRSL
jgi:DNA end-binding protein Ku